MVTSIIVVVWVVTKPFLEARSQKHTGEWQEREETCLLVNNNNNNKIYILQATSIEEETNKLRSIDRSIDTSIVGSFPLLEVSSIQGLSLGAPAAVTEETLFELVRKVQRPKDLSILKPGSTIQNTYLS